MNIKPRIKELTIEYENEGEVTYQTKEKEKKESFKELLYERSGYRSSLRGWRGDSDDFDFGEL